MIRLSEKAESILDRFSDRPYWTRDVRQKYREIEFAYNRFLRVFLLSIQESLASLNSENLDDIDLIISWTYESLYWTKKALTAINPSSGYKTVNYSLGTIKKNDALKEAFDLLVFRVSSYCPQGLFVENSLIRLGNAYDLATEISSLSHAIHSVRQKRKSVTSTRKTVT